MEEVKEIKMSVKEKAKKILREQKEAEAVHELKDKYEELEDAEKIVRNIKRDIADYLEELES